MPASQPAYFNLQEFTDAGRLLVGGRLYTYAYGTTGHKTAFTDPDGTVPHAYTPDGAGGQYIALNARGELPASLYLGDGSYDIVLKRGDGSTVWTRKADGVENSVRAWIDKVATPSGASLVGSQASVMGAVPRSVQAALQDVVSFAMFGSVGNGVEITKNNLAWQKAEAYVNNFPASTFAPIGIFIPDGTYKYSRTPTFTRPVRIFSNGGAILNYVGTDEVIVMGNKAQTSALPGTNDYYEIDNVNFIGAATASHGIYFANWVLQPRVSNCRFLNFGGPNMYALTFQGNNWSIELLDNRYLTTDAAGFPRHWCRCFGVSKTIAPGTISAGQVVNGNYDGGNSRLNALNNWVRFGGDTPGIGYVVTATKSRIVGGGVENPSVGVFFDGTGITIFDAEVSAYFEAPYGYAIFQAAGRVSGLDIHDCFVNLQNDSFYNSTARFFVTNGDEANVTSATFRDLTILSASKYPLVTLRDAPYQQANNFAGRILTDAPMLGAMANHYSIGMLGYQGGYHNNDLLGGLDTSITQIKPAQQRISSRLRVNSGEVLNASVEAVSPAGTGVPPCRNKHFSLTWSSMLAAGNFIAIEARMDDLGAISGGIATAGLVARYVNSSGAASIAATLQLTTNVSGVTTVIASKNITLTNTLKGFALPQIVTAVEVLDNDFLSVNLVIAGAGHAGTSAIEIINLDIANGEYPPPVMAVDRPRQVSTANQWYRRINSGLNQAGAVTSLPIQIGTGWATATRNIKQISLAGAASAAVVPFGDSSVYVQPNPPTGTFDIVFSVEAEN